MPVVDSTKRMREESGKNQNEGIRLLTLVFGLN